MKLIKVTDFYNPDSDEIHINIDHIIKITGRINPSIFLSDNIILVVKESYSEIIRRIEE